MPTERRPGRPRIWESGTERKRAYRHRRAAELADPLAVRTEAQEARAEAAAARRDAHAARREADEWKAKASAADARAKSAATRAVAASMAADKAWAERNEARRLLTSKMKWASDPGRLRDDPKALLALVADLYKELSTLRRQVGELRARLRIAEAAAAPSPLRHASAALTVPLSGERVCQQSARSRAAAERVWQRCGQHRCGCLSHGPRDETVTPAERSMRARIAAYTLHSRRDPRETTAAARSAFLDRFEREVDPECVLPEAERRRRAEAAKKAYFTKLALRSAQARRNRR